MDQAARLRALISGDDRASATATIERPEGLGHIIAVTSGKGGVGKTTVAVNLATLIAETGKSVLLVDADLGLANVDVMLGIDATRHLGHLLTGAFSAEEIAVDGPRGMRVISGGSGLRELADANANDRKIILEKLLGYCRQYDCTIIDTSPGISGDVTDFLQSASEILVVTTPEPTALRDTYAALKTISIRLPETPVRIVVNSASARQAADSVAAVNAVASKFLGKNYTNYNNIEPDELVRRSVRERRVLVDSFPRSHASDCIRKLAKSIC